MKVCSSRMILTTTLMVSAAFAVPAADRKDKNQKPAIPTNLVWPGPPEKPRVRFMDLISSGEDVIGKVKLSFVERMSGRSPLRDQVRLAKPYGVAIDAAGRVFVAESEQKSILIFDRATHAVSQWKGNAQFPLSLPIGLAFDKDGRLFVSDSFNRQILVFDVKGNVVAGFGSGKLQRPGGMAVDGQRGRLYVADAKLNKVAVFSTDTLQFVKMIGNDKGAEPDEPGSFSAPTNLALDSKGRLYVTDTFNCRIQVFDPEGKFVRQFGEQGMQPGQFIRPKGIAIDSQDHVYVIDAAFNNFQIFTAEGKPLMFVGSAGDQAGQFILPAGMAIDKEDRIYVTEQRLNGGRLQIFQYLREK